MPVNGEGDGRIAEHTEVEGIVRVLPDVITTYNKIASKGLLKSGMELIAEPWLLGSRHAWGAKQQGGQDGIAAPFAGQNKIFIEWGFERSRIRNAKHRVAWFDVI